MQKLPVGIQHFPKAIRQGYHYVDKTHLLWCMINTGEGYFFSRPRRFGKSLLTSTFKALFRGEKNLFNSLYIGRQAHDWKQYPVIFLDLSTVYAASAEMLKRSLNERLSEVALAYGIAFKNDPYPAENFIALIRALDQGDGVVILIDEYDQPIVNHIREPMIESNREILKDFFCVIKSLSSYIRFAFVTGVSKFAKVSLFSGMNHLIDISLDATYATLAGITEKELDLYYGNYISETARQRKQTCKEVRSLMRQWYNGYLFSDSSQSEKVYNPVSLHLFLQRHKLSNYWFGTATPTFAMEMIKRQNYPVLNLEKKIFIGTELEESHEIDQIDLLTLLFQTGYLTITDVQEVPRKYQLKFPNEEVQLSFYTHLLHHYTSLGASSLMPLTEEMNQAIRSQHLDAFFTTFNQLLAEIPYSIHVAKESYYHSLIFLVLRTLGLHVEAEVCSSRGRLDLVLFHQKDVFIFEFKMDSSATNALQQIEEKGYAQRYKSRGGQITLIGANINSKLKAIDDWLTYVI